MPDGKDETHPLTTPDQDNGYDYGIADEAEFKKYPEAEQRAYLQDVIRQTILSGGVDEIEPYSSPSGDAAFEEKVNSIVEEYLDAIVADPSILQIDPYTQVRRRPQDKKVNNVAQGADPINLFSGNFVYSTTDFSIIGAGMDFVFTRTHDHQSRYLGPLGEKWDHNYNLWIRATPDKNIIYRSTGALSEVVYRRHSVHGYWLPEVGDEGVIFEESAGWLLRSSSGISYRYLKHHSSNANIFLIQRIEDRFGNYLLFDYDGDLLHRVTINNQDRHVTFQYDSRKRIVAISDFSGRRWRYIYDDLGDLVATVAPSTEQRKHGSVTRYEYTSATLADSKLQHNISAIIDANGQVYLENEYGTVPNLVSYNRVVRQRQGGGDNIFEYANVIENFDFPYEAHERPSHQTLVTGRDGRQMRYLFNRFGNMIFREEYARIGGIPKLVSWHYRYNKDGNLVATISPLGVITQALYGRDFYERRFPPDEDYLPENDPNLTPETRLQFNNLLAVVKRGNYHNINSLDLTGGIWTTGIFPDILQTSDSDIIQKFTYEPEFSQLLTVSDPRFTRSADPAFPEDSEYHRRLTRYSYTPAHGFQNFFLEMVELPTPVLPDGTLSQPIKTRFAEYDGNGRIVRIIAPNSLQTVNAYGQTADGPLAGFLKSTSVDPGGFDIKEGMERDPLGRVVKYFRPQFFDFNDNRFFSTIKYDELGQIVESTSTAPFAITHRNSYDRVGNVSRVETDIKDQTNSVVGKLEIKLRFDEESNLISRRIGDSSAVKQSKVIFDHASRPFLLIEPSGRKRKSSFNERSLLYKTIEDYGGVHAVTRGYYDADGRLVRLIDPRGSATIYRYDTRGRPVDIEDAQGNRTIRHYDKLGNLLVECIYEKRDGNLFALLFRREFSYDELGRLTVAAANRFDQFPTIVESQLRIAFRTSGPGDLLAIKFYYDVVGNLVKQVDQDGREFITDFDILGRAIKMIDPNGNEVRFRYDKEGNITRVDRREVTRDPATNSVIESRHFAEVFAYDELNRLVERRTPTGATRYRYDSRGNRVEIEGPLRIRITNTFDIFSRLRRFSQSYFRHGTDDIPVPVSILFSYNLDDQKITQTDALGRTTTFRYDSAGRLTGTDLPDGSSDTITYDRSGNIVKYRDRNGLIKHLTWDEMNRNTQLEVDASAIAADVQLETAAFYRAEYDALGRFKVVRNDFVSNSLAYNSLNHLIEESVSFSDITGIDPTLRYTIRREFSNSGALMRLVYPSGRDIRYSRDVLDRVVKIEQEQKGNNYPGDPATPEIVPIANIEYEGLQIKRISRHNGTETEFKYDFGKRTVQIRHAQGLDNILTLQFLYDALGNMRKKIELSQDFESTHYFRYDSLFRLFETGTSSIATLVDVSSLVPPNVPLQDELPDLQSQMDQLVSGPDPDESIVYNYDSGGNRASKVQDGITETYETNTLDQYTKVNGTEYRYDPNGNLIEDGSFRFAYDHNNLLARITNKTTGNQTRYFFDYFGRRCLEKDGNDSRIFMYNDHSLLEQYDGDLLNRSVVSDTSQDGIVLSSGGAREHYLLLDLTGSVRYLYDSTAKHNFYVYDEFGNLRNSLMATDGNPFRFAGKRLLSNTGKYDFTFRSYDPSTGRFVQRDPKGFADGTNLYSFLRNNPLIFSDPLGLESRPENGPLAAKLGAELAYRHPPGFTLMVPDNFDDPKIKAAKQRINNPTDRGVGIRGYPPGGGRSRTADLRARDAPNVDAYRNTLSPQEQATIGRGRGRNAVDHVVELQMIIRRQPGVFAPGADTTRPQDYRLQDFSLNSSQGKSLDLRNARQIRDGVPYDTPAGGIARERDFNKFWNREGYRAGMRYFGYYNMVGGTFSSVSSLGDDIRQGNWESAALNASSAAGGMLEIGGVAARSATLLKYGRFLGAPAALASSGVVGVRIGTNLYENYVDKEMSLDAGSWVEEKTGSRILGATAAAGVAVGDAIAHVPEAAIDYARETWTLDPDEIDWDRTLKPWKWF